jgi:hypothetical protein
VFKRRPPRLVDNQHLRWARSINTDGGGRLLLKTGQQGTEVPSLRKECATALPRGGRSSKHRTPRSTKKSCSQIVPGAQSTSPSATQRACQAARKRAWSAVGSGPNGWSAVSKEECIEEG